MLLDGLLGRHIDLAVVILDLLGLRLLNRVRDGSCNRWHVGHVLHGWRLLDGGNWHAEHSWLQVGCLRLLLMVNKLLSAVLRSERFRLLGDLLGNYGLVLEPDLALVVLDIDPLNPVWSRMLENGHRLADLQVVSQIGPFVLLDWRPDRIKAPATAALDEDAHSEAVADSENLALVADEGEHHPGQEVVVDMEGSLRRKFFRSPSDKADKDTGPGNVPGYDAAQFKALEVKVQNAATNAGHKKQDGPSKYTHLGDALPCQRELLQRADVSMRELQSKEEEAHDPQVLIPGENLLLTVRLACGVDLASLQVTQVVSLLNGMEQQDQVIISLHDGTQRVLLTDSLVLRARSHFQVDGLAIVHI